jgi:hypothetical protein
MSIATLKRKTTAKYYKVHSHGRGDEIGFSINGPRRGLGYIGKEQKMSALMTPFRGILPMGLDGTRGHIVYTVGAGTDIQAHQFQTVKPSVVSSREQMNRMRWCCADIVRTQSDIDGGSADLYISKKAAANDCVLPADKPDPIFNPKCPFKKERRLDCENNYNKHVTPVDSSLRTLGVKKQCALMETDPSKLFITRRGTSMLRHGGCNNL